MNYFEQTESYPYNARYPNLYRVLNSHWIPTLQPLPHPYHISPKANLHQTALSLHLCPNTRHLHT